MEYFVFGWTIYYLTFDVCLGKKKVNLLDNFTRVNNVHGVYIFHLGRKYTNLLSKV